MPELIYELYMPEYKPIDKFDKPPAPGVSEFALHSETDILNN